MVTADLNPPLGKPGGPCQVVERIVKRVRDRRLQENLVDDVQQGDDLSNAEASKVYSIDVEPGVGPIHQIMITSHGQYRMDLRGITVTDVQQALLSFVKQLSDWKALKSRAYDTFAGKLEGGEEVEWVDPRSRLKIVFVQASPGVVRLITTYWRGQQDPPPSTCRIHRKDAMVTDLALRVAARYQIVTADGVWLPDLLGSKAHVVDELLMAAKKMAAKDTFKKGDIKSICGGLCYYLIEYKAGRSLADKLWGLLDASSGLDASVPVGDLAQRASYHLDAGSQGKVQAAAIGVSLLQRSKQQTKAQRINTVLAGVLKPDVDVHGDPGEKSKSQSAKENFLRMIREQLPLARVVWSQLGDLSKTAAVAYLVLSESNAHKWSRITESILSPISTKEAENDDDVRDHAYKVAQDLHWGSVECAAFAIAIIEVAGQEALGRKLFTSLFKEVAQYLGPGTMF